MFTVGLVVGIKENSYHKRYCYSKPEGILNAFVDLLTWDGEGYPKELVGEKNLPHILSMLNDGVAGNEFNFKMYFGELNLRKPYTIGEVYKLNFNEIADFIEDNIEFY